MIPSLLHRMILWELIKIFVIALLAITGIMLLGGVVVEATQHGLGMAQILVAIPLLVPSMLPWTIPTTTLFAVCIAYGRLAADNEVLALRAAGVNAASVLWPAILLGGVIGLGNAALYLRIIPYMHHLLRTLPLKNLDELLHAKIKKDLRLSHPASDFQLVVKGVQGRRLHKANFTKFDSKGNIDFVIQADEAEMVVDVASRKAYVTLHKANVLHYKGGFKGFVLERTVDFDLSNLFALNAVPRPSDMSWRQLDEYRASMVEAVAQTDEQLAAAREGRAREHRPEDLPQHTTDLANRRKYYEAEIRQVDVEYQMRPALAFGCLFFVMVGAPVGIWFGRSDYLSAFISCFLPIVFIYYPLMFAGTNLAKEGKLPPSAAVWAADLLMLLAGVVFAWRLSRR